MGYLVLRFWEHEIDTDLEKVVKEIEMAIMKREREEKLR